MTPEEIQAAKNDIDKMSQYEMARMWRFASPGHPYFCTLNGDLPEYFQKKLKEKGGMAPEISKSLGWGK